MMPIETNFEFRRLGEHEFRELDYVVMGIAYEVQNEFGRLFRLKTYYDALNHLLGGADKVVRNIDVQTKSNRVVHQKAHLLNPTTAFKISAITTNAAALKTQLQKFLNHSSLQFIQWVNLNHQEITLTTIGKNN